MSVNQATYRIAPMCRMLGVSPSGYPTAPHTLPHRQMRSKRGESVCSCSEGMT